MKTKEEIFTEIKPIIVQYSLVEAEDISIASTFEEELGCDSLNEEFIITAIEDLFSLTIPPDEDSAIFSGPAPGGTVAALVDYIFEKLGDS